MKIRDLFATPARRHFWQTVLQIVASLLIAKHVATDSQPAAKAAANAVISSGVEAAAPVSAE